MTDEQINTTSGTEDDEPWMTEPDTPEYRRAWGMLLGQMVQSGQITVDEPDV